VRAQLFIIWTLDTLLLWHKIKSSYPCITGRNLYPYMRLGPRGRGKSYCIKANVRKKTLMADSKI